MADTDSRKDRSTAEML